MKRESTSLKSSSSGSYSIGGSSSNLLESVIDKTTSDKMKDLPEKPEPEDVKVRKENKPRKEYKEQFVSKNMVIFFY